MCAEQLICDCMASPATKPEEPRHTRILDIKEVQHRLGCGRSSVYRLEKKGILHRAKQLEGCRTAGWMSDEVDAVVESRRPDRPALKVNSGPANRSGVRAAGETLAPALQIEQAIATERDGPDLVPTTMRVMGKVVYLHQRSGRLLMEIGKLSGPGPGLKLVPAAVTGIEGGEDD